jgi:hypothetical protein
MGRGNFLLFLQLHACTRKFPGGNNIFRPETPTGGITITTSGNTGTLPKICGCGQGRIEASNYCAGLMAMSPINLSLVPAVGFARRS